MNILTKWLRHYLPSLSVTDRQLADDLTLRGIAVEGVHSLGEGNGHLFEMDITTNRVDAMNHYGIAREAATIYNLPLSPLNKDVSSRPEPSGVEGPAVGSPAYPITIEAKDLCGRFTAQILRNVTIAPSTGQIAE
jgi:phenylalanyl-tRNA synthetase beta chain